MIEPVVIDSDAVYDDGSIRQALGLTDSTLATARRAGVLRYSRQGKRTLYLGRWILDWLDSTATRAEAAEPKEAVR